MLTLGGLLLWTGGLVVGAFVIPFGIEPWKVALIAPMSTIPGWIVLYFYERNR